MMEKISTLKLGVVMVVMGPFLWFLEEVFILLPSGIVSLPVIDTILINLPCSDIIPYLFSVVVANGMYISVAGLLLLIKHHFKVEDGDEKIYRFVDYAFALYIALELLVVALMFLLIPFADNSPGPFVGFIYWLNIFRVALAIGFMLFWAYGLFRGYGRMALLFSLCCFVLTYMPFFPYNNADFPDQQDAYYEQMRSSMPENSEMKYVEESDLDLDAITNDSDDVTTVVVSDPKVRIYGPGSIAYLLLLAYTWLRFGRQLFPQPRPKQEQPESA